MNTTGYNFFIGWTFVLLTFWAATKYEGGRTVIYYTAWLLAVLLMVTRYKDINTIFANIGLEPDTVNGAIQ